MLRSSETKNIKNDLKRQREEKSNNIMLLYIIALHYVLIIHFTPSQRDVLELRQG